MNFGNRRTLAVLCSSEHSRANWESRRALYPNLEIEPIYPVSQAWRVLKSLIAQFDCPIVLCQDSVWFGKALADSINTLIEELESAFAHWGACGNRGCAWNGSLLCDYTRYEHAPGGLQTGIGSKPVLTLDDNLVLVNCSVLRQCNLLDLGSTPSFIFGLPLSLECLRHGLPILADPRLFTLRTSQHDAASITRFAASPEFSRYYRRHFVNHRLPWPDLDVDMQASVDYDYVVLPQKRFPQIDLLNLFDKTLTAFRRQRPSVTLCCRTQFKRPELLERALTSFAISKSETGALLSLEVRLVTDCDSALSDIYVHRFGNKFASLGVECWYHRIRPPRYSRTDLLLATIERAETDYIWFVDDDDFVLPGAVEALSRSLSSGMPTVIIGNSLVFDEIWSAPNPQDLGSSRKLEESHIRERFCARDVFTVLKGFNRIPICGMLLPVKLLQQRLKAVRALGNYNEDYFLLLIALTSKQVEVQLLDTDLCGISLRGSENTVAETDRSQWHFSYTSFLQEVLINDDCNPFLWQLANAAAL